MNHRSVSMSAASLFLFAAILISSPDLPLQSDLDLPVAVAPVQNRAPHLVSGSGGSRARRPEPPPVGLPPADDPRDEPPPVFFGEEIEVEGGVLCYVLDTSGSMSIWDTPGVAESRLDKAKRELCRSIGGLSPALRFNVVSYHCVVAQLWPQTRMATGAAKAEATGWVRAREATGGTGTAPGCVVALSDRSVETVVLLTDGVPTCGGGNSGGGRSSAGGDHRRVINNANLQRATINVFGIAASGPWRQFCQDVAADSGGNYYDVP